MAGLCPSQRELSASGISLAQSVAHEARRLLKTFGHAVSAARAMIRSMPR